MAYNYDRRMAPAANLLLQKQIAKPHRGTSICELAKRRKEFSVLVTDTDTDTDIDADTVLNADQADWADIAYGCKGQQPQLS